MTKPVIVAVDGPAGSGKSSVCAKACEEIGFDYINTGLLYRSIAYLALQSDASLDQEADLKAVGEQFVKGYEWNRDTHDLSYRGEVINPHLSSAEVSAAASLIAKSQGIRTMLLPVQRHLGLSARRGAMVDGRDIASVVFPEADLKVFLTASIEERARRRLAQLSEKGGDDWDLKNLAEAIMARDAQDASRDLAPLMQVEDAVLLDTSQLDFEASVAALVGLIREKGLLS